MPEKIYLDRLHLFKMGVAQEVGDSVVKDLTREQIEDISIARSEAFQKQMPFDINEYITNTYKTSIEVKEGWVDKISAVHENVGNYTRKEETFYEYNLGRFHNVVGNTYSAEQYEKFRDAYDRGEYKLVGYEAREYQKHLIDPDCMEGIMVFDHEIEHPENFYEGKWHPQEEYLKEALKLPQVHLELRKRFETGMSMEEALRDIQKKRIDLETCISGFFGGNEIVACKVGDSDIYEFSSNGRHRALAARKAKKLAKEQADKMGFAFHEQDFTYLVKVTGEYVKQ